MSGPLLTQARVHSWPTCPACGVKVRPGFGVTSFGAKVHPSCARELEAEADFSEAPDREEAR